MYTLQLLFTNILQIIMALPKTSCSNTFSIKNPLSYKIDWRRHLLSKTSNTKLSIFLSFRSFRSFLSFLICLKRYFPDNCLRVEQPEQLLLVLHRGWGRRVRVGQEVPLPRVLHRRSSARQTHRRKHGLGFWQDIKCRMKINNNNKHTNIYQKSSYVKHRHFHNPWQ